MALNVPVTMLMSMLVAFTITPWLAYQVLHKKFESGGHAGHGHDDSDDIEAIRQTFLYRLFRPLMAPLAQLANRGGSFLLPDRAPDRGRHEPGRRRAACR